MNELLHLLQETAILICTAVLLWIGYAAVALSFWGYSILEKLMRNRFD